MRNIETHKKAGKGWWYRTSHGLWTFLNGPMREDTPAINFPPECPVIRERSGGQWYASLNSGSSPWIGPLYTREEAEQLALSLKLDSPLFHYIKKGE